MKNSYEGMFLVDAGQVSFEVACEPIHTVLERSDAEILSFKEWDDRKLAYTIEDRKRGLYVLVYFKMDPNQVVELERDVQLNERIIRLLVLRREKLTKEEIEAETPASKMAAAAPPAETPDAGSPPPPPAEAAAPKEVVAEPAPAAPAEPAPEVAVEPAPQEPTTP